MTGSDAGFTQAKIAAFPVIANSGYTVYTIDLSNNLDWTGTLTRLRACPGPVG